MGENTSKSTTQGRTRSGAPPIEFVTLTLRCPVCNAQFTSEIPNGGAPEGRDSDLRPRFAGADPLPSLVQSCPSCRYSAYPQGYRARDEEIDELLEIAAPKVGDRPAVFLPLPDEETLEDLRRWIRRGSLSTGIAAGREPFGAERYLLAARCHEYLNDDEPLDLADYYLRGAWCARSTGDRELERECQREAIVRLQGAIDGGLVAEVDRARALYLIGELSRRCGDFGKAVDLFSQLESASAESAEIEEVEPAFFARLAHRMLALAIVKSEINAQVPEEEEIEVEPEELLD
jgi:uncharacterized protein (DUF2225 family)